MAQYRAGLWVPPDRSGPPLADDRDAPGIITDVKIISSKRPGSSTPISSTPNAGVTAKGSEVPQVAGQVEAALHPLLAEYLQSVLRTDNPNHFPAPSQSVPHFPPSSMLPQPSDLPPATTAPYQQLVDQSFDIPEQWNFPARLPEIDSNMILASLTPLSNFASADEFASVDTMATQSMNDEWNIFMRQL